MTLFKWVRDLVEKYTFVEYTRFLNGRFYIYYKTDDIIKKKVLPYRANKKQLLSTIEKIKIETKWYEKQDDISRRLKNANLDNPMVVEIV